MTEGQRLAKFSDMVRESSLKRFRQVAPADRAWRPSPNQLSFVDLLKHIADADRWVLAVLQGEMQVPRASVQVGDGDPAKWDQYLSNLMTLGEAKSELLKTMAENELSQEVDDWEVMGKTSKWLILLRGNLDHEIHHRGSLQTMLNLKYKSVEKEETKSRLVSSKAKPRKLHHKPKPRKRKKAVKKRKH